MENAGGDFYFRNRRWLLALLVVVVWFLIPPFHVSTGSRIARILSRAFGGAGRGIWERVCYALAAILVGLGAFWRTWGSAYLGTSVVQDRRMHTERLVADGPYRRTRNPLYFGNMLMALGLGMVVNLAAAIALVVGMGVLVRLFIRDEEAGLEQSQGESYRAYREAVPRLLPAWQARIPAAGARPRWVQGACGESILWMFALLTARLAVTLNLAQYGRGLFWGLVISLPLFLWAKRHSRRPAAAGSS